MILQINLNIYIYIFFFKSNSKIPLFTTWQRVSKRLMLFIASKQHSTILGRAHTQNHVKMSIWVLSFQTGLKNINILKFEQVKKEDSCVAFNWLWE